MNVAQFWDGRAADLKEQAGGPIANPGEMAFTHTLALEVLESIPVTKLQDRHHLNRCLCRGGNTPPRI